MSIIEGLGAAAPGRSPTRSRGRGTASFTLDSTAEAARTAAAEPAAPALAVSALGLQEVGVAAPQDQAARRHGHALLAALSRLQRQMLGTADTAAILDELAGLGGVIPPAHEPALAAALHAIVLRARVELARRGL